MIDSQAILIFTDGACSGNPGPGGWASIIALPDGTVRELGDGERPTTNNRMEMTAAVEALASIKTPAPANIILYTDSTYLIKGITQWIRGWRSKGWKNSEGKDVANREIWESLSHQLDRLKPSKVDWRYVPGHAGFPGNDRCDEIAVAFSQGRHVDLYNGPRAGYSVDLSKLPSAEPVPEANRSVGSKSTSSGSSKGTGGGAASYLSYLGGVVRRHSTWTDCERTVKGKSGARFKKTKSAQEERDTLRSWGLDPNTQIS